MITTFGLVGFLSGCTFYRGSFDVPAMGEEGFELDVVQFDDYGSFLDRNHAQATLNRVNRYAQTDNVVVVVFIHGWHHNAAFDDSNLVDFKNTLAELKARLETKSYREARSHLTKDPEVRLIGIYLAWRGKSLPMPLDYLTFWGRKAAAERVGDGDVREFLARLQKSHAQVNRTGRASSKNTHPFMGLISIGHSFGGQVLLRTVSQYMERQLIDSTDELSNTLAIESNVESGELQNAEIEGFGDLNILINPATEAYQFARLHSLTRRRMYPPTQTPQLVVFSAENDGARKTWFPMGRFLSLPFRPGFRSGDQGELFGKALGEFVPHVTHEMRRLTEGKESNSLADDVYIREPPFIETWDFSGRNVFENIELDPIEEPYLAYSPVIVATVLHKIVDDHNHIFKNEFRAFLSEYIAFIQGKRLALRPHAQSARALAPVPNATTGSSEMTTP